MKPKIGIVTYDARSLPSTYKLDDQLIKDALLAKHADALIVNWRNPNIDWTSFDILVLRSCWDSHHHINLYKQWLNNIQNSQVRLVNHIDVVNWNFNKELYLEDLSKISPHLLPNKSMIIPSVFYTTHSQLLDHTPFRLVSDMTLSQILHHLEHSEGGNLWRGRDIILKPTISGDGYNTFLIKRSEVYQNFNDIILPSEAEDKFSDMLSLSELPGVMIQPFIEGIQDGEYSLVYIAGQFSHAVHKLTDSNDFKNRQETNRNAIGAHELPEGMMEFADGIWRFIENKFGPGKVTFARIDMIKDRDGSLILLELELVDPNLQFVRIPELFYANKAYPTESEIRQGEEALYRAIHGFAEAILSS